MTAALEGSEWSAGHPVRTLPPGKTRYPFPRRLGGPQGWSGRAENPVPTGIRSRTVQPVVSRYTDWATRSIYIRIILKGSYRNMISRYGTNSSTGGIKSWVQVNTPNSLRFLWKAGSERQLSCEEGRTDPIGSSLVNMWRRWRAAARRFPSAVQ